MSAVSVPEAPPSGTSVGPPPLGPLRRGIREVGLALITLGVIVLLFVAYQLFGTNLTEARNQSTLKRQFTAVAGAPKPAASQPVATPQHPDVLPSVPPGGAIEHLVIPAIHVDKYVVEGTDEADLRRGPGHYIGTAFPGQNGNTAIAGHRTTYGAPFFELNAVKPGDVIELTDLNDKTWVYVVRQPPVVVSPDDVSVLNPTPFPQLTLTTCNPRFSATSRLVVFARLKGRAGVVKAPPPVGATAPKTPSTLPGDNPAGANGTTNATNSNAANAANANATSTTNAANQGKGTDTATVAANLGHGRSSAWTPSILYGLLVILLWVATRLAINRTRRWYRLGAYVVGIGVCLIPLWFCFENVILLLPQSI